ncbi:hypothetical protein GCM10009544_15830 [Streptomyces stramineus]|uniref:Uncharacterized protein n=1 Tax=Streptomyces stramineus TaxID=173861 RepID=A0ABN0ZNP3_9ACTN
MSPLERLLAEELPTGTFGASRPPTQGPSRDSQRPTGPDPRAAEHRAELEAALNGWQHGRPRRHLRPVPNSPARRSAA